MTFRIASLVTLTMFFLTGVRAQAQTASLDATVGASTGGGGGRNYYSEGGVTGAITVGFRHQRRSGAMAALTFGKRGSFSHGDTCALEPGPGFACRPQLPSVTYFGVLGGIERTKSVSTLRLLAGPAIFGGDMRSHVGGQLLMDVAVGGEHVALVMAARGSAVAPFSHAPLRLGSLEFGLRIQDGRNDHAR